MCLSSSHEYLVRFQRHRHAIWLCTEKSHQNFGRNHWEDFHIKILLIMIPFKIAEIQNNYHFQTSCTVGLTVPLVWYDRTSQQQFWVNCVQEEYPANSYLVTSSCVPVLSYILYSIWVWKVKKKWHEYYRTGNSRLQDIGVSRFTDDTYHRHRKRQKRSYSQNQKVFYNSLYRIGIELVINLLSKLVRAMVSRLDNVIN